MPFGEKVQAASDDDLSSFDGYKRAPSGLDYAEQRYYSSSLGRFVSPPHTRRAQNWVVPTPGTAMPSSPTTPSTEPTPTDSTMETAITTITAIPHIYDDSESYYVDGMPVGYNPPPLADGWKDTAVSCCECRIHVDRSRLFSFTS